MHDLDSLNRAHREYVSTLEAIERLESGLEPQAIMHVGKDELIEFGPDRDYTVRALAADGPEIKGFPRLMCLEIVRRRDRRSWYLLKHDVIDQCWEDTDEYALGRLRFGEGLLEGGYLNESELDAVVSALDAIKQETKSNVTPIRPAAAQPATEPSQAKSAVQPAQAKATVQQAKPAPATYGPPVTDPRSPHYTWANPKPMPDGLPPVQAFNGDLLPETIAPWVEDISDRMQCPPDFLASTAIVAMGAVLGCKIRLRPKQYDEWTEVPNQWGGCIGIPGIMKTPAMQRILKPAYAVLETLNEGFGEEWKRYLIEQRRHEIVAKALEKKAKKLAEEGKEIPDDLIPPEAPIAPKLKKLIVNDITYEALGQKNADNPNGILYYRDELVTLLKYLDDPKNSMARGYFLKAWSGNAPYEFDRIIRGRILVDPACLSLLGSVQPDLIVDYVRQANRRTGGDGLLQRFSLLVWPDQNPNWNYVDVPGNDTYAAIAFGAFEHLGTLTQDSVNAMLDSSLHFSPEAQGLFIDWLSDLEHLVRSGRLHPALGSHLAKYKTLVCATALTYHLASYGHGPVSVEATRKAIKLAAYLETHARRLYAAGTEIENRAARAIVAHIRSGKLADGFTAREVRRPQWSDLTDEKDVDAGLNLLVDLHWIAEREEKTGGRRKVTYYVNPQILPA